MVAATVPHGRLRAQGGGGAAGGGVGAGVDWEGWLAHVPQRQRVIRKPANWRDYRYPFIYGQADPALVNQVVDQRLKGVLQ